MLLGTGSLSLSLSLYINGKQLSLIFAWSTRPNYPKFQDPWSHISGSSETKINDKNHLEYVSINLASDNYPFTISILRFSYHLLLSVTSITVSEPKCIQPCYHIYIYIYIYIYKIIPSLVLPSSLSPLFPFPFLPSMKLAVQDLLVVMVHSLGG